MDFAGPLYVKGSRNNMKKSYIALFSCFVTRAIHLELVENLSAPCFLRCFRRFTARRGTPNLVVSINAKTFKTTAKKLRKILNEKVVQDEMRTNNIDWRFNLERSPWWGGMFERMVGSVKRSLRKVIGSARLNFDEMHTVLVEIENILNSRPLSYVYEDDCSAEILTPSHLLYGRRLSPIADFIDSIAYCQQP